MDTKEKTTIKKDMDDVIASSKKIRELFLDNTISKETVKEALPAARLALEANRNIVSASNVKISVEKLVNGK